MGATLNPSSSGRAASLAHFAPDRGSCLAGRLRWEESLGACVLATSLLRSHDHQCRSGSGSGLTGRRGLAESARSRADRNETIRSGLVSREHRNRGRDCPAGVPGGKKLSRDKHVSDEVKQRNVLEKVLNQSDQIAVHFHVTWTLICSKSKLVTVAMLVLILLLFRTLKD